MSITSEKYKRLVDVLFSRTLDNKQSWSLSPADDSPTTSVSPYGISISTADGPDDTMDVEVRIYNKSGDIVDRFRDTDLKARPDDTNYASYFLLMKELYDVAYRKATGVDDILDSIISKLDDEIPF